MYYELWDQTAGGFILVERFRDERSALAYVHQVRAASGDAGMQQWQLRRWTNTGGITLVAEGQTLIRLARVAHNLAG